MTNRKISCVTKNMINIDAYKEMDMMTDRQLARPPDK